MGTTYYQKGAVIVRFIETQMNYPAAISRVSSVNVMPVPDLVRDDGSGIQFDFWIPAPAPDPGSSPGQALIRGSPE
jgi:hypothetical protein